MKGGRFDLVIAGGGPVGLTLGLGAARAGLSVMTVEKTPAPAFVGDKEETSFDGRMLALNLGSRRLLEDIGAWQALQPFATPILHVHVSQMGYWGVTTLHAREMGVEALGYSILGRDLGRALYRLAQSREGLELATEAQVEGFVRHDDRLEVKIAYGNGERRTVSAALLVGADGTHSTVRRQLGWPVREKDYGSHAVLAQVESWRPHEGWSFERFTTQGPVALLPWKTHSHKAVYVCPNERLDALMSMDDRAWLNAFQARMGARCGGFRDVSPRMAYPLKEAYVPRVAEGRVALMGNASHTQHPVAAQGLNLGLRDVRDYLDRLQRPDALRTPASWHRAYEEKRQADHRRVMSMTDGLIDLFQIPQPAAGHLRGAGLMLMQALPALKRRLALRGMGLEA